MPRRNLSREQAWLLPPSLDDMLPEDHAVRFVAALVGELDAGDWSDLGVDAEPQRRGAPSYPPEALLSIWLYGFMTGVRSSRKLEESFSWVPWCCRGTPRGYLGVVGVSLVGTLVL